MKSKAAIGDHPIHPMIVPVPIGAFFLALVGDALFTIRGEAFWYELSRFCIGVGIVSALLAAAFGAVDYFGVRMPGRAFRIATWHAALNLSVVALYAVSFWLRRNGAAMPEERWPVALAFAVAGFGLLGLSGWLGGKLAYELHVGVVESEDALPRRAAAS